MYRLFDSIAAVVQLTMIAFSPQVGITHVKTDFEGTLSHTRIIQQCEGMSSFLLAGRDAKRLALSLPKASHYLFSCTLFSLPESGSRTFVLYLVQFGILQSKVKLFVLLF